MRKRSGIPSIVVVFLLLVVSLLLFIILFKSSKSSIVSSSQITENEKAKLEKIIKNSNIVDKSYYIVSDYPDINEKLRSYFDYLNLKYFIDNKFHPSIASKYDVIILLNSLRSLEYSNYFIHPSNSTTYYELLASLNIVNTITPDSEYVYNYNGYYYSRESEILNTTSSPTLSLKSTQNSLNFGIVFYYQGGNGNIVSFYDGNSKVLSIDVQNNKLVVNGVETNLTLKYFNGIEVKDSVYNSSVCLNDVCVPISQFKFNKIVLSENGINLPVAEILLRFDDNDLGETDDYKFFFWEKKNYVSSEVFDTLHVLSFENASLTTTKYPIPTQILSIKTRNIFVDGNGSYVFIDSIPFFIFNKTKKIFYYNNRLNGHFPDFEFYYNSTNSLFNTEDYVVIKDSESSSVNVFKNKDFDYDLIDVYFSGIFSDEFLNTLHNTFNSIETIKEFGDNKIVIVYGDGRSLIKPCDTKKYVVTNVIHYNGKEYKDKTINAIRQFCLYTDGSKIKQNNYYLDTKLNGNVIFLPFINNDEYIVDTLLDILS